METNSPVTFKTVMHLWEFINHLGEAAVGLTFGDIRGRPTLCPTFGRLLGLTHWTLVYSGCVNTTLTCCTKL